VGHLQILPMEATVWELTLHSSDPRSKMQYLTSAGCKYWLVHEEDQDALWFRGEGISHFFWNDDHFVARAGPVAVYRMPSTQQALAEFDARATPGTDLLLNGSFETGSEERPKFWFFDDRAKRLVSAETAADGEAYVQLLSRGGARQGIALPPDARSLEIIASARSGIDGEAAAVHYVCYFLGHEKDPDSLDAANQLQAQSVMLGKEETVTVAGQWEQYRTLLPVPKLARQLIVHIDKPDAKGEVLIDSVHVYSR
jgi:hypothetical protein